VAQYARTSELVSALADIQGLRTTLRAQRRPAAREADQWEALTTAAIYHTNHLQDNKLIFEEAQVISSEHRQPGTGSEAMSTRNRRAEEMRMGWSGLHSAGAKVLAHGWIGPRGQGRDAILRKLPEFRE
jgi:hypothetical protein